MLTIECKVHFQRGRQARKQIHQGTAAAAPAASPGRIPRLARLMALAIRFEDLLRHGDVRDYADLARLGHVTRARMTQIMNLLNLAPDIQEAILFLPPTESGRDAVSERHVRAVVCEPAWTRQRAMWRNVAGDQPTR